MNRTGLWLSAMPALMAAVLMPVMDAQAAPAPAMQMHDMQGMENMDGMENMPGMTPHRTATPALHHDATAPVTGRHGHPRTTRGEAVTPPPSTGPLGMPEAVRER
ncbi:hypothetical protein [Gluconacetobacter entanii]|nr:hypothetical protein [Gluconacetobacter entanii]MCE2577738.1 hypothetical protein [Komagataeibacter sp. FNDCR1]